MNRDETITLLAYLQAADHRTVGQVDIEFWQRAIPAHIDLPLALDAVTAFFGAPAERPDERVFFTTRHLMHYVRVVQERRRSQQARESAIAATEQARRALTATQPSEALDGPLTGRVLSGVITAAEAVGGNPETAALLQRMTGGFGRMP